MRTLCIAALLVLISLQSSVSVANTSDWIPYRSSAMSFAVEIPADWEGIDLGKDGALFSKSGVELLESGVPAPKNPWFIILPASDPCFDTPKGRLVFEPMRLTGIGAFREAYACKSKFEIILGYWEGDTDKLRRAQDFAYMLEKLERLP
jgi:hypothetical protein